VSERRMGLVRHGHWLAYGLDQGVAMWLPRPVQRAVVTLWNRVSCSLMGHGPVIQDEPDGPVVCCQCCRSVSDSDDVIRMWQISWPTPADQSSPSEPGHDMSGGVDEQ
jgi:hypothetical protein